jgi:hypothetical protein
VCSAPVIPEAARPPLFPLFQQAGVAKRPASEALPPKPAKRARKRVTEEPEGPGRLRLVQTTLDVGQKVFGPVTCRECGMPYIPYDEADSRDHASHCQAHRPSPRPVKRPDHAPEAVIRRDAKEKHHVVGDPEKGKRKAEKKEEKKKKRKREEEGIRHEPLTLSADHPARWWCARGRQPRTGHQPGRPRRHAAGPARTALRVPVRGRRARRAGREPPAMLPLLPPRCKQKKKKKNKKQENKKT